MPSGTLMRRVVHEMGRLIDFIGAIWVLLTLGVVSKFRLRGRYWSWRTATALPDGVHPEGRLGLIGAGFEYARWAWRMRRMR